MLITVRCNGLYNHSVFVAHEFGNWGPENNGDYKQHQLTPDNSGNLTIDGSFLKEKEEFKLVVPCSDAEEANAIFVDRVRANIHIGDRFDYDSNTRCFWLLADSLDVVRPGEWDQNNVYSNNV